VSATLHYHYDPKLGDASATFVSTSQAYPRLGRPEMPAEFVATVEGETVLSTMWGKREVPWRADPGTPCVILGYWTDNTVRLSWPAISGAYRVDGRFPAWVVVETPGAPMGGGGHILKANNPPIKQTLRQRLVAMLRPSKH